MAKGKKGNEKAAKAEVKRKSAVKIEQGLDAFRSWNGDSYIGNYQATSQNTVIRKGLGKYITDDGTMYSGEWDKDKFLFGTIKYNDFTEFHGQLENHKYNNECVYRIPNVGELKSDFKNNMPQGTMILTDVNGREWSGKQVIPGKIQLFPRNHFKFVVKEVDPEFDEWNQPRKSKTSYISKDNTSETGVAKQTIGSTAK